MILLQVNQISKSYGTDVILSDVKLEVQTGDRVALVGRNGAGKSTLLKIIMGITSADNGEIIKPKQVSLGYLAQDSGMNSEETIWNEMMTVFAHLKKIEQGMRQLEERMADSFEAVHQEYDRLREQFELADGFRIENDIRSILHGLGFYENDYNRLISSLSGGQRTRLALGKLLLTKPDVLILDEPTNHLDIETLSWLESFLTNYPGAILVVSHDRYFLDKITNKVVELSRTHARKYTGNYSRYLEQKAAEYEHDLKEYEKQQVEIAKLKDFIQKNLVRASTTKRAQSRRKQLEKMDILDRPAGEEKSAHFHFEVAKTSGNEVLQAQEVAIGYTDKHIAENITFRIARGESIALIGQNGIGKSTLLKTIIEELPSLNGNFRLGTNVEIGYYDQEQAKLHSNKRVLNELWDEWPTTPEKDIRTVLGHFLFSGDDILKPVSLLSGGEKARVALAKLYMKQTNFLVLDEPTNHLDLDSRMVLENALIDYPGTILFVSHDRYFINRIADKVFDLNADGIREYLGDYDYFLEKKIEQPTEVTTVTKAKSSYFEDKEIQKALRRKQRHLEELEQNIAAIEETIEELKKQQFDPTIYTDFAKSAEIQAQLRNEEERLDIKMHEWADLQEELGQNT